MNGNTIRGGYSRIESVVLDKIDETIHFCLSKGITDIRKLRKYYRFSYDNLMIAIAAQDQDYEINIFDMAIALFNIRFDANEITDWTKRKEDLETAYIEELEEIELNDRAQELLDEGWSKYFDDVPNKSADMIDLQQHLEARHRFPINAVNHRRVG